MDIQIIKAMPDQIDYLLFAGAFVHDDIQYKVAVAETITFEGEFAGNYSVLLVSENGTLSLTMTKD